MIPSIHCSSGLGVVVGVDATLIFGCYIRVVVVVVSGAVVVIGGRGTTKTGICLAVRMFSMSVSKICTGDFLMEKTSDKDSTNNPLVELAY